jgi:Putative zinc-finger
MRLIPPSSTDCDAARESISLALDGELPELQRARLADHLRRCAVCRRFQTGAIAVTVELRTEPLEQPALEVSLLRAPRVSLRRIQAGAVAAAVVLLVTGSLVNGFSFGQRQTAPRPVRATLNSSSSTLDYQVLVRRPQLRERPTFRPV